jgi:secernin
VCDTQVLIRDGAVWFAKNSDREPSEPQPVVRLPAVTGDRATRLRLTYIDIDQVPDRRAVILSKPVWCWGAEMGVNDAGVCIGNEAIFSRSVSSVPALLGMDLVRLGLERGSSARAALEIMTALLERHGQGGPAGYTDKSFCYDSSFLIADPHEAWVLETAGRQWVARRVQDHYAISNALTLGRECDLSSRDASVKGRGFAAEHDTRIIPWFAGSAERRALSQRYLADAAPASFARFARHLRAHRAGERPGSRGDVCMHAAGFVRRHQTTGSMIVRLAPDGVTVMATGTSAPCLSIFRPVDFSGDWSVLTPATQEIESPLWRRHELVHRWALADVLFRERLCVTRDEIESRIWPLLEEATPAIDARQRADRLAASWHGVLFESLQQLPPPRQSHFWRTLSRRDGIDVSRARPLQSGPAFLSALPKDGQQGES